MNNQLIISTRPNIPDHHNPVSILVAAGKRIRQPAAQSKLRELRLLCAGDTENSKQPEFYVEPYILCVIDAQGSALGK